MSFKRLLFCLLFVLFMPVVSAGSFSISSSASKVNVGSSVTIYVSASEAVGKFSVSSSNSSVLAFADDSSSVWLDNSSSSFKFVAKSAGSAVITVTPSDSAGYDEKEITSSKSITITVNSGSNDGGSSSNGTSNKKTVVNDTPKSSINYLSSLGVEGYELSPSFDKDVTLYDVTLPNGTSSINVIGNRESSVSNVIGLGTVSVSEGLNVIDVVVSAENGAKRTYSIHATVEEKEPIIVNVNGSDMTLIRKSEAMPSASDYYTLSTISINEEDIPCYVSEVTGYKLVALKDNTGNVYLYRYDDGSYIKYSEFGFNYLKLSLTNPSDVPTGYTLGSITIEEKEVSAYVKEGSLPLIYGVNLETGESNFYSYDSSEGTIQKFVFSDVNDGSKYYPYFIFGLAGLSLFEFILMIFLVTSKNKRMKKLFNDKLDVKSSDVVYDESVNDSLDHTAVISSSVGNVFDDSKKKIKKSHKKDDDDDMFKF